MGGGISEVVATSIADFVYGPLAENPWRVGKPLRDDLEGNFSARRGDYRIIYTIHHSLVMARIIKIAHRKSAYRTD